MSKTVHKVVDTVTGLAALTVNMQGCNTFTISPAVAEQLYTVPDTLTAAAEFEAAAARNGGVDPEQL